MDAQKVDLFLIEYKKYLDAEKLSRLRDVLLTLEDERAKELNLIELKDPTLALVFSLCFGGLAVDRFYLGQTGLGILKLLTFGGLGIWSIIDWFRIRSLTREYNQEKIEQALRVRL